MSHIYKCTGEPDMSPFKWTGEIKNTFTAENTIEAEVTARSSYFHIILGHHRFGNNLCIPNWGNGIFHIIFGVFRFGNFLFIGFLWFGIEMAGFDDKFWTREKLSNNYPAVSKADIISIVDAVAEIGLLFDF